MRMQPFKYMLPGLMIALSLSVAISSADQTHPTRFALAISGGASMGAYEAGLTLGAVGR